MGRDHNPVKGQWYESLDDEEVFQVLSVDEDSELRFGSGALAGLFGFVFWIGFTIAIIFCGLLFAAIGGRQLGTAATLLTAQAGKSIVASVILWIGVPILAALTLITIVGIPIGLGPLWIALGIERRGAVHAHLGHELHRPPTRHGMGDGPRNGDLPGIARRGGAAPAGRCHKGRARGSPAGPECRCRPRQ